MPSLAAPGSSFRIRACSGPKSASEMASGVRFTKRERPSALTATANDLFFPKPYDLRSIVSEIRHIVIGNRWRH
jgi:hypothetical protein